MLKILSVSDQVDPRIYSEQLPFRYGDVDLVISCGDLSYLYLEYILSQLNKPLYFVHGNHDPEQEFNEGAKDGKARKYFSNIISYNIIY